MIKRVLLLLTALCFLTTPVWCAGNDAYTVLLLNMDGADTSTTFLDTSIGGSTHVMTANGNAEVDTGQKKFGTGSIELDGTDDNLSTGDSADWDYGTANFTHDFWVRIDGDTTGTFHFWRHWGGDADNFSRIFKQTGTSSGNLRFYYKVGASILADYRYTWDPAIDTWYHIEMSRNSTTMDLFIDGIKTAWTTETVTIDAKDLTGIAGSACIGSSEDGTGGHIGWIEEYRISKGIGRHTANFDVPTEAYSEDAGGEVSQVITGGMF